MTHTFPLLQLPYLALEHTIQRMMVGEQFNLSTISKRMQILVRRATYNCKFLYCKIEFRDSVKIVVEDYTDEFVLECEDPTSLIAQITGAFQHPSFTVHAEAGASLELLKKIFNSVRELDLTLDLVMASSRERDGDQDELCQAIFDNCESSNRLFVDLETSSNFRLDLKDQFKVEELTVLNAQYFTVNHLLHNFKGCSKICLLDGKLSVSDLNLFLKSWIQQSKITDFDYSCGVFPDLAEEELDERVLEGIECTLVQKAIWKDRPTGFLENRCFLIRQVDGVEALVWFYNSGRIEITTDFSMD